MKKFLSISVIVLSLLCVLGAIGCEAFSYYLTPAATNSKAIEYTGNPSDEYRSFLYPNLADAVKLQADVKSAHELKQLAYKQKIETDGLTYQQINKVVESNRQSAMVFEERMFGESGFISMGLGLIGAGSLGGFLGLLRKRPGDVTPDELQSAVVKAGLQDPDKFKQTIA